MENITTGHWIFAGVFTICFIGVLIWAYRKDKGTHRVHYPGNLKILLILLVVVLIFYIFKRL